MRRVRVLAVDFGEKRIGLAVSDETGRVVVPVGAVARARPTPNFSQAELGWSFALGLGLYFLIRRWLTARMKAMSS